MRYTVKLRGDVIATGFTTFIEAALWAKRMTDGVGITFGQEEFAVPPDGVMVLA